MKRLREWTVEWWAGRGGAVGSVLDVALRPVEALFATAASIRNRAYDRGWLRRDRTRIPFEAQETRKRWKAERRAQLNERDEAMTTAE